MSDQRLEEIKARWNGWPLHTVAQQDVQYLLSLLDRPVSQDSQEVARDAAQKVVNIAKHDRMQVPHRDTIAAIFATALQSHADAARLAGEQAGIRKAFSEEENDVLDGMLADAHEGGVSTERERIREAVWNLYADHEGALMPLRFVLAAIDGQPVDGGGE